VRGPYTPHPAAAESRDVEKARRYLTHFKKLKEPEEPLKLFFERTQRLG